MTERERQMLFFRYAEIDVELAEIHAGRVVDGDPAATEQELLAEQDAIEFQLGESYIERRDQLTDE